MLRRGRKRYSSFRALFVQRKKKRSLCAYIGISCTRVREGVRGKGGRVRTREREREREERREQKSAIVERKAREKQRERENAKLETHYALAPPLLFDEAAANRILPDRNRAGARFNLGIAPKYSTVVVPAMRRGASAPRTHAHMPARARARCAVARAKRRVSIARQHHTGTQRDPSRI